jgi:transaldolase/glucose-6-phosphate isomerase
MSSPIDRIHSLGQSIWYDNISRSLIENGQLAGMIARGEIRGITSNPSIFNHAISRTTDYDAALIPMAWSGWEPEQIFWQLAIEDIRVACDLFSELHQRTHAADGYISLEVSPNLAKDSDSTYDQARRLWDLVDRPNLMIKIPATPEGLPAIRKAIAAGLNVNVTLIFSLERYRQVMQAYLDGLQDRLAAGLPIDRIASVASFFVSRMDTRIDKLLSAMASPQASGLRGKAAIAYTRLAYQEYKLVFEAEKFASLREAGARAQRPLWASTSTKDPAYPDTLYVDELVGPGTVNTVPPQTLEATRDHGRGEVRIEADLDGARQTLSDLAGLGISLDQTTAELEQEGVDSFSQAFNDMLAAIEIRRRKAQADLGPLAEPVRKRMAALTSDLTSARLWAHDPSLWTADPAGQQEIVRRLGWLTLPETSRAALAEVRDFTAGLRKHGITRVLLLGMGGSSLAPEVMDLVLGARATAPFAILDSTDPAQVAAAAEAFPPQETLYLVSSKSGGTAEVNAMFAYFWSLARERLGENARAHFAAITDPGTTLEKLAAEHGFRKTFLADPNVGGRFSALSLFGLVPAAWIGLDLDKFLARSLWAMQQCAADKPPARNPGLVLGAILGQAALEGRDKLTFLADAELASVGAWLEQLIAESTGKQGKGIVVVDGEPVGEPSVYGPDRLFVYLRRGGGLDGSVDALRQAGHPVLVYLIPTAEDLAVEFYRWEVATAIACAVLGVNAFDQPDVQDNKTRTLQKIDAYRQYGSLGEGEPLWTADGVRIFSTLDLQGESASEFLAQALQAAKAGDYLAINAYLPRSAQSVPLLTDLRLSLRRKTGCATTVGFGPRFLHSTGQLHKGGPASGLFLQITVDPDADLAIPGSPLGFAILERAQALGDYEALAARHRRVVHLHFVNFSAVRRWITEISASD